VGLVDNIRAELHERSLYGLVHPILTLVSGSVISPSFLPAGWAFGFLFFDPGGQNCPALSAAFLLNVECLSS